MPMIFKYDPIEIIYSISIILAELVLIEVEIKIHIIQIRANEFNGFTNLRFRSVCNLLFVTFELFCIFSPFLWLSVITIRFHWVH